MDTVMPKEFRVKFREAAETLTRAPHVNELIKISKEVKEGRLDKEAMREPLNRLYDTYDTLIAAYKTLLPTQPKTENFEIKSKILLASIESFRASLDEITLYFKANDGEHIDNGLKFLRRDTESIMNMIDEFKKDEEKIELYSHAPQINELIRIGKGVIKGEFNIDQLKQRYEIVQSIYEEAYSNIKELAKSEPDTKVLEEQTPVIVKGLELFKEGLDDLQDYFDELDDTDNPERENDIELLEDGLNKMQKASMKIYEAQMVLKSEIDKINKPPTRVCPRCAHEVPLGSKFCSECRAILPKMPELTESTLDISDQMQQEPQEQVMMPPNVKKLYNAAWDVAKGKITKEEFSDILVWFEMNIKENESNMEELLKTPKNITKEEEKLFETIKKNVEEGVTNCLDGVTAMKLYLKDPNISHLEAGLGMVMRGGDQLYGVRQIGEKAAKSQRQPAKKKK